ncbi:MAG: DUF3301 domain-containing protein [Candidatus Competibacterales bacterium]|nr:DUF3301 domain-containing protein [Candidatus Competibacterales bacterium]
MLWTLLALGLGLWFWYDALKARERAREASLRACRRDGVQLLDDTVMLDRLWLRRELGRLRLERRYVFEFTPDGARREQGLVVMLGDQVQVVALAGGDLFVG